MLTTIDATGFVRPMGSGRTKPLLLTCVGPVGQDIEVVVKLSSLMDRKIVGLIAEALAAMLARDLGLPVPTPYLVRLDPAFIDTVTDPATRTALKNSARVTFGCARFPDGYSLVTPIQPLPPELMPAAIEIFAFDALLQNPDRLVSNPNCQSNGTEFAMYDHELAFMPTLFSPPPWAPNGLQGLKQGVAHLFLGKLRGGGQTLDRFLTALNGIPMQRCDAYLVSLPPEWASEHAEARRMVEHIRQLKTNAVAAINEVLRVLNDD